MIEIIYIGYRFHEESYGVMSAYCLRQNDGTLKRISLGDIEEALEQGHPVMIRPATSFEIQWAEAKLEAIKR